MNLTQAVHSTKTLSHILYVFGNLNSSTPSQNLQRLTSFKMINHGLWGVSGNSFISYVFVLSTMDILQFTVCSDFSLLNRKEGPVCL